MLLNGSVLMEDEQDTFSGFKLVELSMVGAASLKCSKSINNSLIYLMRRICTCSFQIFLLRGGCSEARDVNCLLPKCCFLHIDIGRHLKEKDASLRKLH